MRLEVSLDLRLCEAAERDGVSVALWSARKLERAVLVSERPSTRAAASAFREDERRRQRRLRQQP